jgi:hypothetical protein
VLEKEAIGPSQVNGGVISESIKPALMQAAPLSAQI